MPPQTEGHPPHPYIIIFSPKLAVRACLQDFVGLSSFVLNVVQLFNRYLFAWLLYRILCTLETSKIVTHLSVGVIFLGWWLKLKLKLRLVRFAIFSSFLSSTMIFILFLSFLDHLFPPSKVDNGD